MKRRCCKNSLKGEKMFDKIKGFLDRTVSVEKAGLLLGALYALDAHGFVRANAEIDSMLNTDNDLDSATMIDNIYTVVTVGVDAVLDAHQITIDGNLDMKVAALEGLLRLQNWEDASSIVALCDGSSDPIQTLSDLLEMVTDKTWSDFADCIIRATPALIEKLSAMYQDKVPVEEQSAFIPIDDMRRNAILKFLKLYPASIAKGAIENDMYKVGTPFGIIVQNHHEQLAMQEPQAPKQAALELVGIALISNIPFNDFVKQTKDQIDAVYADINFITQVDVEMDSVLQGVLSG